MAKKPHYDPKANARLAWLWANAWGKNKSDVTIIMELMQQFPGTSEQTARKDLARAYERFYEINAENEPQAKAQLEEQVRGLLEVAKNALQLSAAAKLMEMIIKLRGCGESTGAAKQSQQQTEQENAASEHAQIKRERIKELLAKRSIREAAEEAEIDLNQLARDAGYSK